MSFLEGPKASSSKLLRCGVATKSALECVEGMRSREQAMANCAKCGKKLNFINSAGNGFCVDCDVRVALDERQSKEDIKRKAEKEQALKFSREVSAIILTTETAHNLPVIERIEIITAEVAYGMNIFKDLFAGVRDIVGGRSKAVQQTMRDARRTALYELKREAYEVGANAVVGVDLDYVELSGAGNMVMLVASGTAVRVEGIKK